MGNIFIKSTLAVMLLGFFLNGLSVKADIVRPPMPLCKQDGKIIECPDFVPDYDKNDKRRYLNVQHYSVQSAPNKKNKKFKKTKKFKRNKYSSIFISPAYADIIVNPLPMECSVEGKLIDCPYIKYQGKDRNKNDNKIKKNKQQNNKRHKFKIFGMLFDSPAYADIIIKPELPEIVQSAYADVPESDFAERTSHPEQPFRDKTKILLTAVLAVLILIAGVSIKRSLKGKDNDNTNS